MTTSKQPNGETLRRYQEYKREYPLYDRLCKEVEAHLEDMLQRRGIPFCSIDSRVKSFYSMSEHLRRKQIRPGELMKSLDDTAGVRLVVWRPADGVAIAGDIHDRFMVVKTKEPFVGAKASGYRDSKYLCSMHASARIPPDIASLTFELQIQTALMNAWSAIEHDVGYKGPFKLPQEYKNRFRSLAYLMDLSDDVFDKLMNEVYFKAKEQSDTRLNTFGLKVHLDYVVDKVDREKVVFRTFRDWADARRLVSELEKCGIRTLDHVEQLIDMDVVNRLIKLSRGSLDYSSLVRLALIMKKPRKYFSRVMYEDIVLETSWLHVLDTLKVNYKEAARVAGKRVFVDTGSTVEEIEIMG